MDVLSVSIRDTCRARHSCNACGGSHHISICEKGLGENKDEKKERKNHSKKRMKKGMLYVLAICMLVRNVGLLCKLRKAS